MTAIELTQDQKRLLILISKFSRPSESREEEETWIKKIPLMALIYFGIEHEILTEYDFAPTLVEYMGTVRFANISKEGEDDIADLRVAGLLKRLKLATSHHVYVSAYRITAKRCYCFRMNQVKPLTSDIEVSTVEADVPF